MRRFLGAVSLFSLFIILCSFCAACCTANVLKPPTGPELAKAADSETVALVYSSESTNNETFPFCTGVWVAQDVILTAAHCAIGLADMQNRDLLFGILTDILNGKDPELRGPVVPVEPLGVKVIFTTANEIVDVGKDPTDLHEGKVFALYKHLDLALIKVAHPNAVPNHGIAKLAAERPERGEQLGFDGHVHRLYWTYITGTVAAYRDDMSGIMGDSDASYLEGPFMQVSAPIAGGDSGGGAFNSRGELVGIMSFVGEVPGIGFCIPVETIRGVLQAQKVIPIVLDLDPNGKDPKEFRPKG